MCALVRIIGNGFSGRNKIAKAVSFRVLASILRASSGSNLKARRQIRDGIKMLKCKYVQSVFRWWAKQSNVFNSLN